MPDKYYCETMRSAIEDWGGVEFDNDYGCWLMAVEFDEESWESEEQ